MLSNFSFGFHSFTSLRGIFRFFIVSLVNIPNFRGASGTPTSKKEKNNNNGDELRNGADNLSLNDKELTDMSHATNLIINFAKSVVNDSGVGATTRSLFVDEKCNLSVGGDGATGSGSDPASPASNYNERQGVCVCVCGLESFFVLSVEPF